MYLIRPTAWLTCWSLRPKIIRQLLAKGPANSVVNLELRPEGESFKIKRWRDVNVTSTLVNVSKTLTNVDASRRPPYLSKSARRWRLKAYLSKAETLTWRQRFGKHTLGILLVDVWVECKHKQRSFNIKMVWIQAIWLNLYVPCRCAISPLSCVYI